ncbi:MAG: hypothetical protein LAO51_02340 [Acidobacteriia bacterium]|nr:hypothetical protein [Terriglobia bacterium]
MGYALIGMALVLLFAGKLVQLVDLDIFYHLAVGEWILDHREIPHTGLFSATRGDAPWVDNEWGFEVVAASVHRRMGVRGLVLLSAFLPTLAAAVLGAALRRRGVPLPGIAAAIGLVGWGLGYVNLRPQLVTYVFLAVFLAGLADVMEGRTRAPLVYLPLSAALWANMHGGFIVGLTVLAIPVAVELLRRAARRPPALPLAALTSALALSSGAAFLNPYGWRQVVYPLEYALRPAMTSFNGEWQPITLATLPGLTLLLAAVFTVFALSPRRPSLHELALALAFVGLGLKAWRHVGLVAYVGPVASASSAAAGLESAFPRGSRRRSLVLPVLVTGVLLGGFVATGGFPSESPFHFSGDVLLPVDTANFFAEHRPPGALFNQYGWGGYLIYRFKPESVVFVDGRNDLYGEDFMADVVRILSAEPGSEEILERYHVGSAMLAYHPSNSRLIRKFLDAGWVCVHRSTGKVPVVLLIRRTDEALPLIEKFGMALSAP